VLALPHAIALSAAEAQTIRRFVERGGTVIADREPGLFDRHSRKLPRPLLHDLFPGAATTSVALGKGRAITLTAPESGPEPGESSDAARRLRAVVAEAGLRAAYPLSSPAGEQVSDVETHRFRNGAATLIALQRDLLSGAATSGEVRQGTPQAGDERVVLTLPEPLVVTDMRAGKSLGRTRRLELVLDPVTPTLLAVSAAELPKPTIAAPARLRTGETATLRLGLAAPSPAARHALSLEVTDPSGKSGTAGNVVTSGGAASYRLAVAVDDPVGVWTIRVTDALSGKTALSTIAVSAGDGRRP
jgi:hypothetical protein